jgi:hypothetical protein
MKIEIQIDEVRRHSLVLVDGEPIKVGLIDFDVDLSGDIPKVMLKIWPEKLTISANGELCRLYECRRPRGRWIFRRGLRSLFGAVRAISGTVRDIWRETGTEGRS